LRLDVHFYIIYVNEQIYHFHHKMIRFKITKYVESIKLLLSQRDLSDTVTV